MSLRGTMASLLTIACRLIKYPSDTDSIMFYTTCSSLHHEEMIKTHLLPVVAVEYSKCFKQVLTACEESVKYHSTVYTYPISCTLGD